MILANMTHQSYDGNVGQCQETQSSALYRGILIKRLTHRLAGCHGCAGCRRSVLAPQRTRASGATQLPLQTGLMARHAGSVHGVLSSTDGTPHDEQSTTHLQDNVE